MGDGSIAADLAHAGLRMRLAHALGQSGLDWNQSISFLEQYEEIVVLKYRQDHRCPGCGTELDPEKEE